MSQSAYYLAMYVGDDALLEKMQEQAEKEGACIVVYKISGDTTTIVADYEESPFCVVHRFDSGLAMRIAQNADKESEVFQVRLSELLEKTDTDSSVLEEYETDRLITVLTVKKDGNSYVLFFDASLYPVESTVRTLRYQLVCISTALIFLSVIIAFFLANYISAPIESINKSAKNLVKGKFETESIDCFYKESEELSRTLSHTADELSKVDRLQKELIANVSHDLRTPLTMIIGYGEVMRDIKGENTPENVQVIIDEATRLSGLVNDLLEISHIQGGSEQRRDEVFDISHLVKETLERYMRLKENDGYAFSMQIDEGALVLADKGKILQVVCNLLNNAIHYSHERKEISVFVEKTDKAVRVSVIDRGIGIASEDLENIWQRYYKVDKTHRRGSGLGLSIVKEILELHGARYGVKSKLGEGSVFWFLLPLYKENGSDGSFVAR